jgi:hypothetical protein
VDKNRLPSSTVRKKERYRKEQQMRKTTRIECRKDS